MKRPAWSVRGAHSQSSQTVMTLGLKEAASAMRLVDALDEHDDVQHVFTNFDIPDEVLEQLESEES